MKKETEIQTLEDQRFNYIQILQYFPVRFNQAEINRKQYDEAAVFLTALLGDRIRKDKIGYGDGFYYIIEDKNRSIIKANTYQKTFEHTITVDRDIIRHLQRIVNSEIRGED